MKNLSLIMAGALLVICEVKCLADAANTVALPPGSMDGKIFKSSINVKDFGARGDGITDDSPAFQRAIAESGKNTGYFNDTPKSRREIVVPQGNYLLHDTIWFTDDIFIRGIGNAILKQANPARDIIYGHRALHGWFENITFDGGRHQIRIWTDNRDSSVFTIRNCKFLNSSAVAVECQSYAKGSREAQTAVPFFEKDEEGRVIKLSPYVLESDKNGQHLIERDLKAAGALRYFNSTLFTVEGCIFKNCFSAVSMTCDGIILRHSRIETNRNSDAPAIAIGNRAHLYQLDILVNRNSKLSQSVLEIYGSIIGAGVNICMEDSVIRTDNGQGVCLVSADFTDKSYVGQSLILRNLKTESAGCPENALVRLRNNRLPNIISISNINDSGKGKVKALGFETMPDSTIISHSTFNAFRERFTPKQIFSFSFGLNSDNIDTTVPGILQPFVRPLSVFQPPFAKPEKPEFTGRFFYAEDYGVDLDSRTDDTAAMKRLFAAVAEEKDKEAVVVLPGSCIRLTETIEVPDGTCITAAGIANLIMNNFDKDFFTVEDLTKVQISHIAFEAGRRSVTVSARAGQDAIFFMEHCYSTYNQEFAVRAFVENDESNKAAGKLKVLLANGSQRVEKFYEGNADAYSDGQWLATKRRVLPPDNVPEQCVAFVNYGRLQVMDLLGVPMPFRKLSKDGSAPSGTPTGDYRWIDNYGEFNSQNSRFGGERGGHCIVYAYGSSANYIHGGSAWFNNARSYKFLALVDSPETKFIATDVVCAPYLNRPVDIYLRDSNGNLHKHRNQKIDNIFPME